MAVEPQPGQRVGTDPTLIRKTIPQSLHLQVFITNTSPTFSRSDHTYRKSESRSTRVEPYRIGSASPYSGPCCLRGPE